MSRDLKIYLIVLDHCLMWFAAKYLVEERIIESGAEKQQVKLIQNTGGYMSGYSNLELASLLNARFSNVLGKINEVDKCNTKESLYGLLVSVNNLKALSRLYENKTITVICKNISECIFNYFKYSNRHLVIRDCLISIEHFIEGIRINLNLPKKKIVHV